MRCTTWLLACATIPITGCGSANGGVGSAADSAPGSTTNRGQARRSSHRQSSVDTIPCKSREHALNRIVGGAPLIYPEGATGTPNPGRNGVCFYEAHEPDGTDREVRIGLFELDPIEMGKAPPKDCVESRTPTGGAYWCPAADDHAASTVFRSVGTRLTFVISYSDGWPHAAEHSPTRSEVESVTRRIFEAFRP
jgi:hypothetical protein